MFMIIIIIIVIAPVALDQSAANDARGWGCDESIESQYTWSGKPWYQVQPTPLPYPSFATNTLHDIKHSTHLSALSL